MSAFSLLKTSAKAAYFLGILWIAFSLEGGGTSNVEMVQFHPLLSIGWVLDWGRKDILLGCITFLGGFGSGEDSVEDGGA